MGPIRAAATRTRLRHGAWLAWLRSASIEPRTAQRPLDAAGHQAGPMFRRVRVGDEARLSDRAVRAIPRELFALVGLRKDRLGSPSCMAGG